MKCPECGSDCWRNEVHNGVCLIHDGWKCENCLWDEDCAFPMSEVDWDNYLNEMGESLNVPSHPQS